MKCTGRFKVGPGAATLVLEPEWIKKWASSYHPVYVVLVKVPSVVSDWIDGEASKTLHRTVAFGKRFDPSVHSDSVKFTGADRLTTETLYDWRDEIYNYYEGRSGSEG